MAQLVYNPGMGEATGLTVFPRAPRCLVCGLPLSGMLGEALQWAGIGRSSRNPNCCTRCNTHLEEGRLVEMTMLFADLSAFTEMTTRLGAEPTYDLVDRYLRFASEILTGHGAFIDKYVGDSVMAFFNLPIKRADHAQAAVAAAREIQEKLPGLSKELGVDLRAAVGIATGFARVGRLGSDDIKDFSAIGDVVNQAARLQAQALGGEIVVSERVYRAVAGDYPGLAPENLTLKGFRDKNVAYRLHHVSGRHPAAETAPFIGGEPLSMGGLVMALLGAGCLGVPIVATAAVSLGIGSAALVAAAKWLDQGPLHFPFLAAAAVTAGFSLAALRREHRYRKECQARGSCVVASPKEKFHNLVVAALSLATLSFVAVEVVLHFIHYKRIL